MDRRTHRKAKTLMAVACALAGGFTAPQAMGQGQDQAPQIVVEAPRSVPLPVPVGRSETTGATITITTVKMPVLYGDLDLRTAKGADSLLSRVHWVAVAACNQLDRLYPLNPDEACVKVAAVKVLPAARTTIATARATDQLCQMLSSLLALGADGCPPRPAPDAAAPDGEAAPIGTSNPQ